MQEPVELSFHGKSLSVLDLRRIAKAKHQGFDKPITAYLGSAFMNGRSAAGIIFGHQGKTLSDDLRMAVSFRLRVS